MPDLTWTIGALLLGLACGAVAGSMLLRSRVVALREAHGEMDGRLRTVEQLAGAGAWDWNPATGAFALSETAAALLGVRETGQPGLAEFVALAHADDRAAVERAFKACAESGEPIDLRWRHFDASGRLRHLVARGHRDGSDAAARVRGALSDVSDRVRGETALKESQTIIEAFIGEAPVLIHFQDPDGRITLVNKAYTAFTGVAKEDAVGARDSFVPADIAARFAAEQESGAPGAVAHEFQVRRADGEPRWLSAVRYPVIAKGELLGAGTVAIDVTERREA